MLFKTRLSPTQKWFCPIDPFCPMYLQCGPLRKYEPIAQIRLISVDSGGVCRGIGAQKLTFYLSGWFVRGRCLVLGRERLMGALWRSLPCSLPLWPAPTPPWRIQSVMFHNCQHTVSLSWLFCTRMQGTSSIEARFRLIVTSPMTVMWRIPIVHLLNMLCHLTIDLPH